MKQKQTLYGLLLFAVLALPPVAAFMESIMIVHMHMQMPLIVAAGWLMGRFAQLRWSRVFSTWNSNGVPGILLFVVIMLYWMIPRTMDEALTNPLVEGFKFVSLAFLAGVPLRDSWGKLDSLGKNSVIGGFAIVYFAMGWLYANRPEQLCNNYLLVEQITLGWGFLTTAACMVIYLIYQAAVDRSAYE